ncbi:MAG: sulfate adenylyltransferase [Chloroflexi bacterium]|nr:sulfate adenylyltransferase [Chloroflexota bacterium]
MTGILPHGGTLVNRVLRGEVGKAVAERAQSLPRIALDSTRMSDLELIATGALSPLTGFMGQVDYEKVVREMRLASNLVWTIPVVLPVSRELAATLAEGQEVALCEGDRVLAVMEVREKFEYDKQLEAQEVYRTTEEQHPGVARLYGQGEVLLGGDIWLVDWPSAATTEFPDFRFAPADTRRAFAGRGWKRIVGFQTRNPIHRAHEYIQKVAMELVDGLMLHPLVGETKGDDIPADVRMMSYQTLLSSYYPADRVMLGVFPAAMRYAGPREAVFHAIARKNYGVTHFIVGRDHAGVGNYYGTYDAQRIFDNFRSEEIGLTLLFFDHTFYCRKCGGIVSIKTCPHDRSEHVVLSGTQVRQLLERGEALPTEFTRPEVSKVLVDGMQAKLKAKA